MKPNSGPPAPFRVCRYGCSPEPQPLSNFYKYSYPSRDGFDLYRAICKACTGKREAKRVIDIATGKRVKSNVGRPPGDDRDLRLAKIDLVPCGDCGLRGHISGDKAKCIWAGGASLGLGQRGMEWAL
jgi:hypothetical protein